MVYRDVVIWDSSNEIYAVFNVTENDLNDEANYSALKELLMAAVGE